MVKALITGISGQDGSYLSELLLSKGYEVHGLIRRNSAYEVNNIEHLKDKLILHYGDILADYDLLRLICEIKPDEMYNLAGQSDVKLSFDCPQYTKDVNGKAVGQMLEILKQHSPGTKFYQASTSELFGNSPAPQNEKTPFDPQSPYAISKEEAFREVVRARNEGLFACNGILMNHESPRRGLNFVTRKVTNGVAQIVNNCLDKLHMGNLDSKRDWGYAKEYVFAMWLMLQQDKPDDYVIGTGETHSIRELLFEAFSQVGLDWQNYVEVDQRFTRSLDVHELRADATKARIILGWQSQTKFKDLVNIMLQHDLEGVKIEVKSK